MNRSRFLSFVFGGVAAACIGAATATAKDVEAGASVVHVDAAKAAELLKSSGAEEKESDKIVVLDVRTPEEFKEERIEGAKNVDFKAADFKEMAAKLDKGKPYLVHCRSGKRSTASLEVLKELGFTRIYHLDGGILAWMEAGQKTVSGDETKDGK